ncbi:restriction endonuclease subunit M, partial [Vibrio parahaemolyticus]
EDSGIRGALLLLSNSKKRNRKVRFADLTKYFDFKYIKSSQTLPQFFVEQIVERLFCEELPEAIPLPPGVKEGTIGTGVSTRAFWDVSVEEIENNNWDLNPVRNEDDALTLLLTDFRKLMGDEIEVENLSKVAQINTGKSVRSTEQTEIENPYGYIRIRDIESFIIQKSTTWLQEDLARAYSLNQLYKGNILISKTGTIGKLALVDDKSEGAFAGNNFYVLRINSAKVLSEYLLYYLSTSFCQDWLDSRKRGAVQQHINK